MADDTANMDNTEFTCRLCSGNYLTPRSLPTCGHSFCEQCLLSYARDMQKEYQGHEFNCPVCGKSNCLPGHDGITLQWIQSFPLNSEIIRMMEYLPRSSEEVGEERKMCNPCTEEGDTTPGLKFCLDCKVALCKTCTKFHKNLKLTKNHKLIEITEMSTETSREEFYSGVGKCVTHPDRDVEIYCKSHDIVICSICSTFEHKNCDLTEIMGHQIDIAKLQQDSKLLMEQMKTAVEQLQGVQKLKMDSKQIFIDKLKDVREDIEQIKDLVVEVMETLVDYMTEVTKQLESEKLGEIDEQITRVRKTKELTEQNMSLLDTIEHHGSKRHKFVSVHLMKKQLEETTAQISEESKQLKRLDAELVIANDITKLIETTDFEKLAHIKVIEKDDSVVPAASRPVPPRHSCAATNDLKHTNLIMAEEHVVRPDPEDDPLFNGAAVCNDGRLILCDHHYPGRLCLYNPIDQSLLQLQLQSDPYSAVQIDDTHLAVSSQGMQRIDIVSIGQDLAVDRTLKTKWQPGILVALSNNCLAVAWGKPPGFGVIDISGPSVLQKLYMDQDATGREFKSFQNLAVNEAKQLVIQPCMQDKAVYGFHFSGQPVFTYTHPELKDPRGVALDRCGNMYICGNNSPGSIHRLSPTGGPLAVFRESVSFCPRSIGTDSKGEGFWVVRNTAPRRRVVYFKLVKAGK